MRGIINDKDSRRDWRKTITQIGVWAKSVRIRTY